MPLGESRKGTRLDLTRRLCIYIGPHLPMLSPSLPCTCSPVPFLLRSLFSLFSSPFSPLSLLPPLSPPLLEEQVRSGHILSLTLGDETHFQLHKTSPRTVLLTRECCFCGQAHAQRDSGTCTQPGGLLHRAVECRQCCSVQKSLCFPAAAKLLFELFILKPFLVGFCDNLSQIKENKKPQKEMA